jgi:hypothetical protein
VKYIRSSLTPAFAVWHALSLSTRRGMPNITLITIFVICAYKCRRNFCGFLLFISEIIHEKRLLLFISESALKKPPDFSGGWRGSYLPLMVLITQLLHGTCFPNRFAAVTCPARACIYQ